jgi:hypothetical protein
VDLRLDQRVDRSTFAWKVIHLKGTKNATSLLPSFHRSIRTKSSKNRRVLSILETSQMQNVSEKNTQGSQDWKPRNLSLDDKFWISGFSDLNLWTLSTVWANPALHFNIDRWCLYLFVPKRQTTCRTNREIIKIRSRQHEHAFQGYGLV